MIVDFDGRILAQAEPGPGERIVVGPVDIPSLRAERARRQGHHMLSHLRTELYRSYEQSLFPPATRRQNWPISIEGNGLAIEQAKRERMTHRKSEQ
jgi:hypothetical protein